MIEKSDTGGSLKKQFRHFAIFCLVIFIVLIVFAAPTYLRHNRETKEMMSVLEKTPAFPDSRIIQHDWEVGSYEGASNLCEGLAYIIVQTSRPEPQKKIADYYNQRLSPFAARVEADFHIARADQLPPYPPDEIVEETKRLSPSDRVSTYIIWGIRPLDELTWDVRGW